MAAFELAALALKAACPTNELLMDDKGLPGAYVQRSAKTLNELLNTTDSSVHPAFIVSGNQVTRLLFGKYQGKAHNGRIYPLPGEDPTANITLDTYERYCKAKGNGHHCITAAEWAFLTLSAKKNGTMPRGNNSYGKDASESSYLAIPTTKESNGRINRVATGTGPLTWSDTGDRDGIFDLNGNVSEWVAGIRLVKGELQCIPDNDAADPDVDTSASSGRWKAINANATGHADLYIDPDGNGTTANSVKLDYVSGHWQWGKTISIQDNSNRSAAFANTTANGLSDYCQLYLQAMALLPEEGDTGYEGDYFWANNAEAERCAFRGGGWGGGVQSGVFCLSFSYPRSLSSADVGGRPAFYE